MKKNNYALKLCAFVCLTAGLLASFQSGAKQPACKHPLPVTLTINPIFDLTDPNTIWIHRFANAIHINTKPSTIRNEMAYMSLCHPSDSDLAELERNLRAKRYLRDAKVKRITDDLGDQQIKVETWDTWSMMPTISFGRRGGKNHFSVGIKDRNVLGMGIDADLNYFTDPQHSGYRLKSKVPLYMGKNAYTAIELQNNNDGQKTALSVVKPFISFNTQWASSASFNEEKRTDSVYQNINDVQKFEHDISQIGFSYGWKAGELANATLRYSAGYQFDQHTFTPLADQPLPQDRQYNYPWLAVDYEQHGFKKLTDIYLIGKIEDFNLGWHLTGRVGFSPANSYSPATWIADTRISKGLVLNDKLILLAHTQWRSLLSQNGTNRINSDSQAELFYRFHPHFGWYNKIALAYSRNAFIDTPLTLGGDNDLRGYPTQYQHGSHSVLMSTELRYYPHINLYKLFDLGAVAFVDVGKAGGATANTNIDNGWLSSVGMGLRIYSNQSSERQVVHIDLAHPLARQPGLSNVEFRIEVKQAF